MAKEREIIATSRLKSQATRRKGRGFDASKTPSTAREGFERGNFAADASADSQAQRSVEGYIVLLTNLHEETTEEDVQDAFAAFGQVRNMHLNLDRRTGYVKGYALLEYATFDEAEVARLQGNGLNLLGNVVAADWAFVRGPLGSRYASVLAF